MSHEPPRAPYLPVGAILQWMPGGEVTYTLKVARRRLSMIGFGYDGWIYEMEESPGTVLEFTEAQIAFMIADRRILLKG